MLDTQQFVPRDASSFSRLIGITFTEMEDGVAQCTLDVQAALKNPLGIVHGGVIYTIADTGMGGAVYSTLKEQERCVTVEIKITYFRFVTMGTIECNSKVVSKTGRHGFAEAEVYNAGELIAKASGTFSILPAGQIESLHKTTQNRS
jgi:acyl-CoA thioesterase